MAADSPWLVVGLGNPGPEYAAHRHNVGFGVVESWAERASAQSHAPAPQWVSKWKAKTATVRLSSSVPRIVLTLPQTYMNRSGESVAAAAGFLQVSADRVVVVHDELDFEFGRVAIKRGGGHGGHNGLRDITAKLGTAAFNRIRVGIGRPRHGDVSNWVLSPFVGDDSIELPNVIERACEMLDRVLREGVAAAMNAFNTNASKKPKNPKIQPSTPSASKPNPEPTPNPKGDAPTG